MKKYSIPTLSVVHIQETDVIATSITDVNNNVGVTYGGAGNGFARTPGRRSIWD